MPCRPFLMEPLCTVGWPSPQGTSAASVSTRAGESAGAVQAVLPWLCYLGNVSDELDGPPEHHGKVAACDMLSICQHHQACLRLHPWELGVCPQCHPRHLGTLASEMDSFPIHLLAFIRVLLTFPLHLLAFVWVLGYFSIKLSCFYPSLGYFRMSS